MSSTLRSVLWSVLGILVCGIVGAVGAFALTRLLGLTGVPAALVGAILGMIFATAAWVVLTFVLRKLGVLS